MRISIIIFDIPIIDQKNAQAFLFLIKSLSSFDGFIYSNKNGYYLVGENSIEENIIWEAINKFSWSICVRFNALTNNHKDYYCVRPIHAIEYDDFTIANLEKEKTLLNEKWSLIEKKLIELEVENIHKTIDTWKHLVNNPMLIYTEIRYNLPNEILETVLWKEFYAIYVNNMGITIAEENLNVKDFDLAINSKLYDLYYIFHKDLSMSIDNYKELWKKRYDNALTIYEHVEKVKSFVNKNQIILAINYESYIQKNIDFDIEMQRIDVCSHIVTEHPHLLGSISRHLYSNSNKIITILAEVYWHIYTIINYPFSSSKDPFGVRKNIQKLFQCLLEFKITLNFNIFLQIPIKNKFIKFLKEKNNLGYMLKIPTACDFFLNLDVYKRVKGLLNKTITNDFFYWKEEYEEQEREYRITDFELYTNEISSYINSLQIHPYYNRLLIIKKYADFCEKYIDVLKI